MYKKVQSCSTFSISLNPTLHNSRIQMVFVMKRRKKSAFSGIVCHTIFIQINPNVSMKCPKGVLNEFTFLTFFEQKFKFFLGRSSKSFFYNSILNSNTKVASDFNSEMHSGLFCTYFAHFQAFLAASMNKFCTFFNNFVILLDTTGLF